MRPRFLIFTLFFGLAILALIFYFRPANRVAASEPTPESAQITNKVSTTPTSVASIANQNVSSNQLIIPSPPASPQSSVTPPVNPEPIVRNDERRYRVGQKYNKEHNAPIEFYGSVIDQNSNPVPDLKITVEIQQPFVVVSPTNTILNNNVARPQATSDTNGRFQITNEKGSNLSILSAEKEGYMLSPDTQRNYGITSGSFETPVTIKVLKLPQ